MQFIPEVAKQIYRQSHEKALIKGVSVVTLPHIAGDEGDFQEVARIDPHGCLLLFPQFHLRQINRTRMVHGCIKGFHLHERQDEIWYLTPVTQLTVGLYDVRQDSSTSGAQMRFTLGGGVSQLLYIPRGVAHGSVNLTGRDADLLVFVNEIYDATAPDELRLPHTILGADFWNPERD